MVTAQGSLSVELMRMLQGFQLSQAISVAARLGIADLLKDGPRSSDELHNINMLVGPGGRERTAEEFEGLFSAAGFRLKGIIPLEFSYSIIEGVPI